MGIVKTKRFHLQRIVVSITSANDKTRDGGTGVAVVGGAATGGWVGIVGGSGDAAAEVWAGIIGGGAGDAATGGWVDIAGGCGGGAPTKGTTGRGVGCGASSR